MGVSTLVWIITIAVIIGFFIFDFFTHIRTPHEPSVKESAFWTGFYIAIAVLFMVVIGFVWNWDYAGQYIAGYALEKSLSVDNLFVFMLLMTSFKVPKLAQQKVLLIGIAMALVFRLVFILLGAAILERFAWVFYIFGAWLLFMAIRQAIDSFSDEEPEMPGWVNWVRKIVPTSENYNVDRWTIVEDGVKKLTPMVLVIIALGITDVVFAFDSIPAIFGVTTEAYLVFTANAAALMGLRQMYFLINTLMDRLKYLDLGIAVILGFIGVKLVFHAMHVNEVPFINGGQPIEWAPEIPTWLSLVVIFGVLVVTTVASLLASRNEPDKREVETASTEVDGRD